MSELESFVQNWEAHERSRHARLLEELKREFWVAPKAVTTATALRTDAQRQAIETALDVPNSVRLPQSVPRQQVKPQGQARTERAERSPRVVEEYRRE